MRWTTTSEGVFTHWHSLPNQHHDRADARLIINGEQSIEHHPLSVCRYLPTVSETGMLWVLAEDLRWAVSNQDELLQQVADHIETLKQAEAAWAPEKLTALQNTANLTSPSALSLMINFRSKSIEPLSDLIESRFLNFSLTSSNFFIEEIQRSALASILKHYSSKSGVTRTDFQRSAIRAINDAVSRKTNNNLFTDFLVKRRKLEAALPFNFSSLKSQNLTGELEHSQAADYCKEIIRQVLHIDEPSVLKAIENSKPGELAKLLEEYQDEVEGGGAIEAPTAFVNRPVNETLIHAEIIDALEGKESRKPLTPAAFFLLCYILTFLSATLAHVSQWKDFREGLCALNDLMLQAESTAQAQKWVRSSMCHMPKSAKARVRLVARDNVYLRYSPSMKAEVIMLLKQYAVVEVVNSNDKTWLEVIYKHEDIEIQGWVSRSMVKTVP